MENKINIAQLLKDCPKGMELDCTLFEDIEFDSIVDDKYCPIRCRIKHSDGGYNIYNFTKYGCWNDTYKAKCVIFPKGKTTWEGFQRPFKDGDILTSDKFPFIYKNCDIMGIVESYCGIDTNGNFWKASKRWTILDCVTFATEEEKAKLFDAIKTNGYRWNAENKTLDKIVKPMFKINDVVVWKHNTITPKIIKKVQQANDGNFNYWIEGKGCTPGWCREDELQKISGKFDITTLKPFDKVLVRDNEKHVWCADFYSHYNNNGHYKYICLGHIYRQCIPYEGNEHLLGTTNDCDDFYKTWEK